MPLRLSERSQHEHAAAAVTAQVAASPLT